MWFGDFVTMKWFNDVWMKEVFANFMAAKIVNPTFPAVNHELRFLFQNYPSAYDVDRTDGANPIRQELANLDEAGTLYGAIIYQKAPIVMRQLELLMGADAFRDGLREYLKGHAFGNATWTDLVSILDVRTPADLASWSKAWVDERGRPSIRTDLSVAGGKIDRLSFHQEDASGRPLVWTERLQVLVGGPAASKALDVTVNGADTPVPDASGLPAPKWVLPVGRGLGYGFFDLDRGTLDFLTSSLHTIRDPLTRGAALVALWEAMLEGRVEPAKVMSELLTSLPQETDELIVQQLLDDVRGAFWRYTAPDERTSLAPRVEGGAARGPRPRADDQHARGVVQRAPKRRDDARHGRLARARLVARGDRAGSAAVGDGRGRSGARPRAPRRGRRADAARNRGHASDESRSQGAIRLRHARGLARSGRARQDCSTAWRTSRTAGTKPGCSTPCGS